MVSCYSQFKSRRLASCTEGVHVIILGYEWRGSKLMERYRLTSIAYTAELAGMNFVPDSIRVNLRRVAIQVEPMD